MSGMMHSRPFRCSGIRIHMSQSQSWGGETATHTLGTAFATVAIQAPFWVPTPGPAPLALALWMVMCLLKSLPVPNPFCLGILPSISTGIAPPGAVHPRDWVKIRDC